MKDRRQLNETITIRLSDVQAAMLVEVQKTNKPYRDLKAMLLQRIREQYAKKASGKTNK